MAPAARTEGVMKQYLLSMYQPEGGVPPPEFLEKVMRDVGALRRELEAKGAWVFGGGLHDPSTATVVRLQDGEVLTTDGPFAEGKEHIGGFTIIKAPDLDAALEWGRQATPGRPPSRSRCGRSGARPRTDPCPAGPLGLGDRTCVPRGVRPRGGRPGPPFR